MFADSSFRGKQSLPGGLVEKRRIGYVLTERPGNIFNDHLQG
jgi:hypothetical protein